MKTVFVSGHKHITDAEFAEHYMGRLDALLMVGVHFLVADADGFDAKVQGLLADSGAKVTVYHMKDAARNNVGGFPVVGGFQTAKDRDRAMTDASEEDVAWVRPGRVESGVGANVRRRSAMKLQLELSATPALESGSDEDVEENAWDDDMDENVEVEADDKG